MGLAEELPLPLCAVGIGAPTCGGFQGAASTWPGPMWVLEVGTSRMKASVARPAPCQFPHELERMESLTVEELCAGPFWDVCCAAWCHWTLQVASIRARPSMAHSPSSFLFWGSACRALLREVGSPEPGKMQGVQAPTLA